MQDNQATRLSASASAVAVRISSYTKEKTGGCFPVEPFRCCPTAVYYWIPGTWRKIQDWIHVMLVLGMATSLLLILKVAVSLPPTFRTCIAQPANCAKEIVAVLFAIPFFMYIGKIIGQYDEELRTRQKKVEAEKANLLSAYQGLLSDMDALLARSAESASSLAERGFESKRRDFMRFLDKAKSRFAAGAQIDPMVIDQFKKFCMNWLKVFRECSIDPVNVPKDVVTEEEMSRCATIQEIADFIYDRLRLTEVKFISIQAEQDSQMLVHKRRAFRLVGGKMPAPLEDNHMLMSPQLSEGQPVGRAISMNNDLLGSEGGAAVPPPPHSASLCHCGPGSGCGARGAQTEDGYPVQCGCLCASLKLLSRQHVGLLLTFLLGLVVFGLQGVLLATSTEHRESGIATMLLACLSLSSVAVVLVKFEDIDICQQLEREVQELQRQKDEVREKREEMNAFWGKVQNLTELWLHRTVPRLDVCQELHNYLEDVKDRDLLSSLANANQGLTQVDMRLGSIEEWCNDGSLSAEDKKAFSKTMAAMLREGERDFDQVVARLKNVAYSEVMDKLGDR